MDCHLGYKRENYKGFISFKLSSAYFNRKIYHFITNILNSIQANRIELLY